MLIKAEEAIERADKIVRTFETRNGKDLAEALGITVIPCHFKRQKGAYTIIEGNRFIFLKDDLQPVLKNIVLLHEIGHDTLHREEAMKRGGFQEFNIFDMSACRMEYEANIFAAQVSLPDDEILEYIEQGYDVEQIERAMNSDINLVALKVSELRRRGFPFKAIEHRGDFLKAK